ncbi:hypothetical protein AT15_00065 [Kosmotoga arenicorallina S304]|uniref:CRISPR-associated protein Cas5 n=1 Tax=Kosmotoga arenicorallina S304 TaxID=1453497 RepID=A0A182C859_9BACT|nr:CRISPR-associated protein Cas5 [Kosmotoga arenicorallina]OAA32508.1 hypothetical protein AT15_00065 [Kosmotoga arenicorallina S304]
MKVLRVKLRAYTASFRKPQNMKIQDSFPFPPPTSIIGLFGAAMGVKHDQALERFENSLMGIKVNGSLAKGYDLWKIKKTDKGRKNTFKSLVKRQFYYFPEYTIYLLDKEEILQRLYKALKAPKYALSLGRDDELITHVNPEFIEGNFAMQGEIENVVIKGLLKPGQITLSKLNNQPIKKLSVYRVTKNFQINSRKGYRTPVGYCEYTFVDVKVKYFGELLCIHDEYIPLWRWSE